MSADLSPCPFCGGIAYASAYLNSRKVVCDHCGASTLDCPTATMAAELWNARPGPAKVDPAPGTVRIVRRYEVWSDGAHRPLAPDADPMLSPHVVAGVTLYNHVVTVTADLPLPPAPVVVAGTVETS